IYLQADLGIIKKRIETRDIEYERHVNEKYLEKILQAFDRYFFDYKEAPLLIINTNNIDFMENKGDIETLIKKIESHKRGIEYFSPLGSV
ncbi:MAG: deoxynucleoside kinase, partial [Nitrospinota bacterium]